MDGGSWPGTTAATMGMELFLFRHSLTLSLMFAACLAPLVRAGEAPPAPQPSAVEAAQGELADLPIEAREALELGRVVLLESVSEENQIATKMVAVVESRPEGVITALRDYDAMKAFPEVRKMSAIKGTHGDTFSLTLKPHPLLPPMDFTKAVEWSLDQEGSARVGVSLLSTTSQYLADQTSDYRILPLDDEHSLVFLESRSSYSKLSFRKKVQAGLCESSEKWLEDVQERCAARPAAKESKAGSSIALLSTGAVAAPIR